MKIRLLFAIVLAACNADTFSSGDASSDATGDDVITGDAGGLDGNKGDGGIVPCTTPDFCTSDASKATFCDDFDTNVDSGLTINATDSGWTSNLNLSRFISCPKAININVPAQGGAGSLWMNDNFMLNGSHHWVIDFDVWVPEGTPNKDNFSIFNFDVPALGGPNGIALTYTPGQWTLVVDGASMILSPQIAPSTWTHVKIDVAVVPAPLSYTASIYLNHANITAAVVVKTTGGTEAPTIGINIGVGAVVSAPAGNITFDNVVFYLQ